MGRRAVVAALIGLVLAGMASAETRFQPMQQFEVKPISPSPDLNRSAESYAGCAGEFSAAVEKDSANSYASAAASRLMAKAIFHVGPDTAKARALYAIRTAHSAQAQERERQRDAGSRRLYNMTPAEQAAMPRVEVEAMLGESIAEVQRLMRCYLLLEELEQAGEVQ